MYQIYDLSPTLCGVRQRPISWKEKTGNFGEEEGNTGGPGTGLPRPRCESVRVCCGGGHAHTIDESKLSSWLSCGLKTI